MSFEEKLREQRQRAGKQAGLEFRQEFRTGNSLKPGNNIYLQVTDADRDVSKDADTIKILVTAGSGSRSPPLTETGPHTGIFRGTLKTVEIAANVFASDRSAGNEAVRAIDNNSKTSWEGLNDGRAPKFIAVDLKQDTKLGTLKWSNDGATKDKQPVEYAIRFPRISPIGPRWRRRPTTPVPPPSSARASSRRTRSISPVRPSSSRMRRAVTCE